MAGGVVGPVAGAADEDASVGPITEGARPVAGAAGRNASVAGPAAGAAGPVAGAADEDVSVGPITEGVGPVAGVADVGTAKVSQTGQAFPLKGWIAGTTRSRMAGGSIFIGLNVESGGSGFNGPHVDSSASSFTAMNAESILPPINRAPFLNG